MSIKNRDSKEDIRIKTGPWVSHARAQQELHKHGYARRLEMNDLPIMYERKNYPAMSIATADNVPGYLIVKYPTDAEIYKMIRGNNPEGGMKDRMDKQFPEGHILDFDKDKT